MFFVSKTLLVTQRLRVPGVPIITWSTIFSRRMDENWWLALSAVAVHAIVIPVNFAIRVATSSFWDHSKQNYQPHVFHKPMIICTLGCSSTYSRDKTTDYLSGCHCTLQYGQGLCPWNCGGPWNSSASHTMGIWLLCGHKPWSIV